MKLVRLDKKRRKILRAKNKEIETQLRDTLTELKKGDVDGIVLLVERPDGGYCERHSGGRDLIRRIGLLDVMKDGLLKEVN